MKKKKTNKHSRERARVDRIQTLGTKNRKNKEKQEAYYQIHRNQINP